MARDDRPPADEIPPIHVLEAMEREDRKRTEELLQGFDRPVRTPRRRPSSRDFVDYYTNTGSKADDAPSSRRAPGSTKEKPTFVLPRSRKLPRAVGWAAAVLGMVAFGVTIAILATPDASRVAPSAVPSSATTITNASAVPSAPAPPPEQPPQTATDTLIEAPPPAPQTRAKPAPSSSAAPPPIKIEPRDDFIRDL